MLARVPPVLAFFAMLASCGPSSPRTANGTPTESLPVASHTLRVEEPLATPLAYRLALTLDPKASTFQGVVEIDVALHRAREFVLNGQFLQVESGELVVAGRRIPLRVTAEEEEWLRFQSDIPWSEGQGTVRIRYLGTISDVESYGLFRQRIGETPYLFTQLESRGARRVVPSLDQPDHKVPWTVTITAPLDQTVLSNTPQVERTEDGSWQTVRFAQSKPIPSYLLAIAVGPLELLNAGTSRFGVPIRIAAPRGRGQEAEWAKDATGKLLAILEDYTKIPYPYAKLDSVSIPATGSFGAMENPGLITYSESFLLSPDNHQSFQRAYASIAAHELAHQWFGNLVTSAWWDDIWLNESFATWGAAKVMAVFDPQRSQVTSFLERREHGMGADELGSARRIREPVNTAADIESAFDGITYAKGGTILGMVEHWLGEEKFQKAIESYLRANAWTSAGTEQFLAVLPNDAQEVVRSFIETAGTPVVSVGLECPAAGTPTIFLAQERFVPRGSDATQGDSYVVPVCVRVPEGKGTAVQCTTLREAKASLTLEGECPGWVIPNAGGHGYYRATVSPELLTALAKAPLTEAEERALAFDVAALVRAGKLPPSELWQRIEKLARAKDWGRRHTAVQLALRPGMPTPPTWVARVFGAMGRQAGLVARPSEAPELTELRTDLMELVAVRGGSTLLARQGYKLAQSWLKDPASVPADSAQTILMVGASQADAELLDELMAALARETSRSRRRMLMVALAFVPKEHIERVLDLVLLPELDPRESYTLLVNVGRRPDAGERALQFLLQHKDDIAKRAPKGVLSRMGRVIGTQCTLEAEAAVEAALQQLIAPLGNERRIRQLREQYRMCRETAVQVGQPG